MLIILSFSLSSKAQWGDTNSTLSTGSDAEIKWDKKEVNLKKVKQYDVQDVVFKLKNTGDKPIIITQAKGTCGCTKIKYPRAPIAAGKSAEIFVTFDAEDVGVFRKTVTLTMNIEDSKQKLYIKGEVVKS